MPDENAPRIDSARYVVPIELDTTKVDAALDAMEERVERIAGRLEKLRDLGGVDEAQPSGKSAVDLPARVTPEREPERRESGIGELRDTVRRNTEAVLSLRDAVESLTEVLANSLANEEV